MLGRDHLIRLYTGQQAFRLIRSNVQPALKNGSRWPLFVDNDGFGLSDQVLRDVATLPLEEAGMQLGSANTRPHKSRHAT